MNAHQLLRRSRLPELLERGYRVDIAGGERIPPTGPAILAANHESIWDPFILGLATSREIHYMAKAELFRLPGIAALLRALNAFPVERGRGDRTAISQAATLLRREKLLGIFPQGTSIPERQNGWHRGAARLALVTGAPLIPVRLSGTRPLPRRTRIRIEVGEPIRVPVSRPTIAAARSLTARLEQAVAA